MEDRKPNNRPWVIPGGIAGLVLFGLLGFGVYSGAKGVSDEMRVASPEEVEAAAPSEIKKSFTVLLDDTNNIFLDGDAVEDVAALRSKLVSLDLQSPESTLFIIRADGRSLGRVVIAIQEVLEDFEVRTKVEIFRPGLD